MKERDLCGIPAFRSQSYRSIDQLASTFRRELGYEDTERFDAMKFFNKQVGDLEVQSKGQTIAVEEAVDKCQQEGLVRWDPESTVMYFVLSEKTHSDLRRGVQRATFTVAHEAGHLKLHTEEIMGLAGLNLQSQAALHRHADPHPWYLDTEWQANAFAAALLMPKAQLTQMRRNGWIEPREVAEFYGVSETTAKIRIMNLRRCS